MQSLWTYSHREKGGVIMSKLTSEERRIVVEAMRAYPAGVSAGSWGKSAAFFNSYWPNLSHQVEALEDAILLEGG